MARRSKALVALVALVAAIGAVAWLAPTSSAQTQIQLLDREGPYEKFIDVGKVGPSPGDTILESHPLLDPADGSTVGRDFARLTFLKVIHGGEDLVLIVDGTIRLADGDITLYGTANFSGFFAPGGATIAVTGGTGAYEGMSGSANFAATDTEGEFLITIELVAG